MLSSTVIFVWGLGNLVALGAILLLGHGSGAWLLFLPLTGWPALLSIKAPASSGERRAKSLRRRLTRERLCLFLCVISWLEMAAVKALVCAGIIPEVGPVARGHFAGSPLLEQGTWFAFFAIGGSLAFTVILKMREKIRILEATRDFYRAQVREVELRNQAIVHAIPDRIFILSASGLVLDCNSSEGDELLGDMPKILGRNMIEVHPPSPELSSQLMPTIQATLETGTLRRIEYHCATSAGDRRFEARVVPCDVEGVMMISRDVTRDWLREQEIEKQRAQMITSSRLSLLGEMAGGVAHEINNPLAIIQGHACLLQAGKMVTPEAVNASAQKIETSVDRISRIVRSLRVFARETSDDPVARIRVSALLAAPLELFREKMRKHGIALHVGPVPEELELNCKPAQISQALLNLLSNAFDSVRDQPGESWVELKVAAPAPGHEIEFSVNDSGRGVPSELRDRVFDPFFTTKEPGRGTGLGLSFCLGVAQNHGGTLQLASANADNGRSSRFILRIPKNPPGAA